MNKIICITGASAGFGEATARKFSSEGWDCIVIARRGDRLLALKKELESNFGERVLPLVLDVTKRKDVEEAISSLPEEWQKIDVLVNNAGLASGGLSGELIPDDIEKMIDVNIKGVIYMSEVVIPLMKKYQKSTKSQGHIINIGSIVPSSIYKSGSIYCLTKKATQVLGYGQRIDLLKDRIKVTTINPGRAKTEISLVRFKGDVQKAEANYKDYEPLSPEDIADGIFYCASAPDNVCVDVLTLTPLSQADMNYFHKENE